MRLTPGSPQPIPIGGNQPPRHPNRAARRDGLLSMNLGNPPTFGLKDIDTGPPIGPNRAEDLRGRAQAVAPYSGMFSNNLPGYGSYMPQGAQQELSGLASNLGRQYGQRNLQSLNYLLTTDNLEKQLDRARMAGQVGTSLASLNARLEGQQRRAALAEDYVKNVLARLLA